LANRAVIVISSHACPIGRGRLVSDLGYEFGISNPPPLGETGQGFIRLMPRSRPHSIREDTAKYLLNLDVKSAYYDPKTRSMRENPLAGTAKEAKGVC
jgi:hypothetical protein